LGKKRLKSTFSQGMSVDLNIEHGKTMRRITCIMYSLYCLALQSVQHYPISCPSCRKTFLSIGYVFWTDLWNCQP